MMGAPVRLSTGCVACLWALAAALRMFAQATSAVEGTIWDPSGGTITGAAVRILEVQTNSERRVATDGRGRYLAAGLAPGIYDLEASHPGFRTEVRRALLLDASRTLRVDFSLVLGEARESVIVEGQAPLVSASASDWGGSVKRDELAALPLNGRDLFDLAAQEPGTTVPTTAAKQLYNGFGIHISVNGARPNQNSYRLDGVYINDATGSAPASASGRLLGLEAIQELRLVTSPFSAEYGRAAGAVVTAVSKSGSNDLHGSAFEFLRNSALDAKNFFNRPDEKIPPLRKNQFGGLLSGPLRRDHVFFLGTYEGIRETLSRTDRPVTLTPEARQGRLPGREIPVAPQVRPYLELYPLPNGRDFGDGTAEYIWESVTPTREDYWTAKLDANLSDRLRFWSRYTFDDADTWSSEPFGIWRFGSDSRYQFLHTEMQYLHSPNTIHSLRASFSRVRNSDTGQLLKNLPPSLSFVEGQPLGSIQVVGLADLGGLPARLRPRHYVLNDYGLHHDVTHVRGPHTVRLGGGYNRVQYNQVSVSTAIGHYRFNSVTDFLQARPRAGELALPESDPVRGWRQRQFFAFAQEELRARRGVSITLGVRYETYTTPTEVNGKVSALRDPLRDQAVTVGEPLFENPARKNFAPRAAVAWDVTGSGRTVLRAGAGIFFDLIGSRELIFVGTYMPPFAARVYPNNPGFPNLLETARGIKPGLYPDGFDYSPQQPYVAQWQLAVQRQMGAAAVISLGYAGSRGVHLVGQLGNMNPPRPEVLPDGRLFFPEEASRLNPAFEQIGMRRTQFNSFYHGLLAAVQKTWRGRLRLQGKYSWSKSIDETSSAAYDDFASRDRVPTMFNYRMNRGLSEFDLRHAFAANFSWQLWRPSSTRAGRFLGGWEVHGLAQAQTGHAFNPRVGFDRARLRPTSADIGQRPDFVPQPGASVILGDPQRWFDPSFFALPDAGFYGTLGRNTLSGPGLATVDLALHKVLRQSERSSLRLRMEVFNVANHPNFQVPSGQDLFNSSLQRLATAGRITATTTTSRQIQLALKWAF